MQASVASCNVMPPNSNSSLHAAARPSRPQVNQLDAAKRFVYAANSLPKPVLPGKQGNATRKLFWFFED